MNFEECNFLNKKVLLEKREEIDSDFKTSSYLNVSRLI